MKLFKFSRLWRGLVANPFLALAVVFLLVGTAVRPAGIWEYSRAVDWPTLAALASLLIATTGLEMSGAARRAAQMLLRRAHNERTLALSLVAASGVLSTALTNDVTLFVMVPLTLALADHVDRRTVRKLVIFEAIAVNVGSALTPMGNPQNVFLWHNWGISIFSFMMAMLPLAVALAALLALFTACCFPSRPIAAFDEPAEKAPTHRGLFYVSVASLGVAFVYMELRVAWAAFVVLGGVYALFFRDVLRRVDWLLLLLFVVLFVDTHIAYQAAAQSRVGTGREVAERGPMAVYWLGVLLSQVVSNIPAALWLSKVSSDVRAIAYAVNVAGNGLVLGSLANVIALSMAKDKRVWVEFHKYSIPFLLVSAGVGAMVLAAMLRHGM